MSIVTKIVAVGIATSKWFKTSKYEPGQPGVFEVNAVHQFDAADAPRRFSFFNGKQFGPISTTAEGAYAERFNVSCLTAGITHFRGLSE